VIEEIDEKDRVEKMKMKLLQQNKQRMDLTSAAGINPEPARDSKSEKASKPGAWAAE
jgi:hypothetical protein